MDERTRTGLESLVESSMEDEVLTQPVLPEHRTVEMSVKAFVRGVVMLGLKHHAELELARKTVEGWYPPDKVDERKLEKLVLRAVKDQWGSDPGADIFARMLTHGDYIT